MIRRPVFCFAAALAIGSMAYAATAQSAATAILHSFAALDGNGASNVDGTSPNLLIRGADGTYLGTASSGGPHGSGDVFSMTASGTVTVVHAFDAETWSSSDNAFVNQEGAAPNSLVRTSDGSLYGAAGQGGAHGGGTLFKITPAGVFSVLRTFPAYGTPEAASVGFGPGNLIQGTDGYLYGLTAGGAHGGGTLFRMALDGTLTTLYSPPANSFASHLTLGNDGALYGTTGLGGAYGYGSVFRFADGTYTTLYSFTNGSDGYEPTGVVQGRDGALYGSTSWDGNQSYGHVFKLTLDGKLSILHTFAPLPTEWKFTGIPTAVPAGAPRPQGLFFSRVPLKINAEGLQPMPMVLHSDGNLYGAMWSFGIGGHGTLFRVTPDGSFSIVYSFYGDGSPIYPLSLLDDGQGNLLEPSYQGGASNNGVILRLNPNAPLAVSASFSSPTVKLFHATQFSWSASNAQSCQLIGDVPGLSGNVPASGSKSVTMISTKTRQPAIFYAGVDCIATDGSHANATATLTIN